MIPVSSSDLEAIAFSTGATISMGGRLPTLQVGRLSFAAVDAPRPDPRSPLDILAADPRVRVSATGSYLDAESGDES